MISGKAAQWLRLPDVALFLIAGMIVGQAFHWINESSTSFTNQFILVIGSTLILFDGGRNIRLSGLRKVWLTVSLLSVPGVLITCGAVAVVAHLLLDLPWLYALLLGAIIASTDPATLIPVFKQVKIRAKVRETVESESAFNDATASILTFSLFAIILGTQEVSVTSGVIDFVKTALGGLLAWGCYWLCYDIPNGAFEAGSSKRLRNDSDGCDFTWCLYRGRSNRCKRVYGDLYSRIDLGECRCF